MAMQISVFSVLALIVFIFIFNTSQEMLQNLENPAIITGYILIAVMVCVALLNLRKKLTMLPIGNASTWLRFHVVAGVFCMALFWLHTGIFWPKGLYEQFLAGIFYLVSLSGILGYIIQKINSRKLTETGIEVIYERIPLEISEIRKQAEEYMLECTENTGSETLANHYIDSMAWYFQKPRFVWSTLFGAGRATVWIRNKGNSVKRYLNKEELEYLNHLLELAEIKKLIDTHFARQSLNKKWLLFHVPLSTALIILALWHFLLVEVYRI